MSVLLVEHTVLPSTLNVYDATGKINVIKCAEGEYLVLALENHIGHQCQLLPTHCWKISSC